jgi:hypothetical protein
MFINSDSNPREFGSYAPAQVTFRPSHCVGVVAEKLNAFAIDETKMVVNATCIGLERILSYSYKERGCSDVNTPKYPPQGGRQRVL